MDVTEDNIKEILAKPKAILDFWAPWCSPCVKFGPIFKKVSAEFKNIEFGKVNIEEARDLAQQHEVMSIPTIIFFADGKEVGRFTGGIPEQSFKDKIREILG